MYDKLQQLMGENLYKILILSIFYFYLFIIFFNCYSNKMLKFSKLFIFINFFCNNHYYI